MGAANDTPDGGRNVRRALYVPRLRVIGPGRAGTSMARALERVGWDVVDLVGRGTPVRAAAHNVDLLVIATPDGAVADAATAIEPVPTTVVAHLSGSLGLDALAPHPRRAAVHPLVALPTPEVGAERLLSGGWFAIAGDPMAGRIVADLGGRPFEVADEHRAAYHAAAVIASNHLVALLAQVDRVAARAGAPLDAYLHLVRATVDNVSRLGPAAALTGPAARGDWATIDRHLAALPQSEHAEYRVLAEACRRLATQEATAACS